MSRRKEDKAQSRIILGLLILLTVTSGLASYLGYKAIKISGLAIETLETYNDLMHELLKHRGNGLAPDKF